MKGIPEQASERVDARLDLRAELDRLERMVNELKILFEQYFTGVLTLAPDKAHNEVKRKIRTLRKAPFKSSEMYFRLRNLETRYNTFNTYWQRILREREEGTYSRDIFKAKLREKIAAEEAKAETTQGKVEKHMEALFNSYREAVEKQSGRKQNLDFEAFQKNLVQRAKDFKEKHGVTKLTFKVVVKDGKVTVQAKAKES